jgi:two-component system sensor histidine kinase SenX3
VRRDFVANVSHELKTPVGALSLLSEAVTDAADDPEAVTRFAGRMQTEAVRLTNLVQELIDLSRVQDDGPIADPDPVPVDALVDEAVSRIRQTADKKNIEIAVADAGDLCLRGDRDRLSTALGNLVENAVNYSPEGTRVAIGFRTVPGTGGSQIELTVTDQGIGIPEKDRERIFERFYRVDPARSRQTGGTGLGLSIVKHVVAAHGGQISVWSVEGQGSTFTVRLPAHKQQPPAQAANREEGTERRNEAPGSGPDSEEQLTHHAPEVLP